MSDNKKNNNIRVTYSGLIGIVIKLSSLITGLIFSVTITRNLVPEEYGLYSVIVSLITYAMFSHIISTFWITRHVARNEAAGRTALVTNAFLSLIGMAVYLIAVFFVIENTDSDFNIFLLASLLIPASYIGVAVDSINHGFRPQALSYSFIVFEIVKIPFILLFIEIFDFGLFGAILATLLALLIKIVTGIYFALPRLKGTFNLSFVKYWLRMSWLSLYGTLPTNIYVLDTLIVTVFFHSSEPIAFFAAAMAISLMAGHAGILTNALGPKLLADPGKHHVQTVIRLYSLIGIPLLVLVLVFAKPLLFVLNPLYVVAVPIVYFTSFRFFTFGIFGIFRETLAGVERVDVDQNAKVSQFVKSNLFLLGTINYVRTALYLIPLIVFLIITNVNSDTPTLDIIIVWSFFGLVSELVVTIYAGYRVNCIKFITVDLKPVIKYLLVSVSSGIVCVLLIENYITFDSDLFVFLPQLALLLGIGTALYFVPVYLIDGYCRTLLKTVLQTIR